MPKKLSAAQLRQRSNAGKRNFELHPEQYSEMGKASNFQIEVDKANAAQAELERSLRQRKEAHGQTGERHRV